MCIQLLTTSTSHQATDNPIGKEKKTSLGEDIRLKKINNNLDILTTQ